MTALIYQIHLLKDRQKEIHLRFVCFAAYILYLDKKRVLNQSKNK